MFVRVLVDDDAAARRIAKAAAAAVTSAGYKSWPIDAPVPETTSFAPLVRAAR